MRRALAFLLLWLPACGTTNTPADAGPDLVALPDLQMPPDLQPLTTWTVFLRGTLKNDPAASKTIHDMGAGAGKAKAISLGDTGHFVFLNLPAPPDGGQPGPSTELLIVDQWTSLTGFMQFASDPAVQQTFAALLAGPPSVTVTNHPPGWTEWGMINPKGQGMPLYAFSIRGTFAAATTDEARAFHNQVAGGFMGQAMQAGDVCHQARLVEGDPKQYQGIDLWNNIAGPQMVYGDPQFQAVFGQLFSGPPQVEPYTATDWVQW